MNYPLEKYNIMILSSDVKSLVVLKNCLNDMSPESTLIEVSSIKSVSISTLKKNKIELLFIDIDDLAEEFINFLQRIDSLNLRVVLVSSSSEYAVKAIPYAVVSGYLLRPLLLKEVKHTVQNVLSKIVFSREYQTNRLNNQEYQLNFIAVSSVAKIDFVKIENILYCEADGRYTTFFLESGKNIVSSKNLGGYEKLLANKSFFRIHHRYLVNLEKVEIVDKAGGNYCILTNEKSLPIAKRKQELLIRFLKIK